MTWFSAQSDLGLFRQNLGPPTVDPAALDPLKGGLDATAQSALDLLNSYTYVFVTAFLVTLLCTPLVRRLAIAGGVIDRPDAKRKLHQHPVAYLGGLAVFAGLLAAVVLSYAWGNPRTGVDLPVPFAVIVGMVAITFTGLADDVWGWDPRLKIAGQLVAAAALAINDIGVRVAEGLLTPILGDADVVLFSVLDFHVLNGHVFYWTGTALIAFFVLGSCNAANLIDGLDGLLSGVTAVVAIGLLAICLLVAPQENRAFVESSAQAQAAAAAVQQQIEVVREREGRPPADLAGLPGPAAGGSRMPAGWTLDYDPGRGQVTATDARRKTAAAIGLAVTADVRRFRDREARFPRGLDEVGVARAGPGAVEMPAGYALRYNPNSGQVAVRGGEASLSGVRIILCLALLGVVLGFLPHNFAPASIFLGDSGSLLLGYMCAVIILMLGDRGQTYFVFAGLIVFSVPIIDTTLAIIRRRLAGASLSAADDQHLHHQLKRALGGVRRAVFALYGISALFAVAGVSLVVLVLHGLRVRVIYALTLVLFSFIAVIAVKEARRQKLRIVESAASGSAPGTAEESGEVRATAPEASRPDVGRVPSAR